MIMKKNLLYILTLVVLALTSCESPEYVAPTVQRQSLTSISAIFTSGPFTDQEMAKLNIAEGEIPSRLVIPVPYFYPVTSDNETTEYMTNVRVKAEMAAGCSIEPAITVLDLTKENAFVFTDAQGKKTNLVITGERVKSSACELMAFSLVEPAISGIIDKATKKVSVISADDLSDIVATADISAHATISPDPAEPHNYNEPVVFTVTAHDGVTKAEYTVVKEVPEKIDFGFDKNSVELLFNMDPVSNLGMPAYNTVVGPTVAALKGKVVLCVGDGSTPIYINGISGAKMGEIKLGAAVAGSITNDEAEHLLIVNKANGGETLNIYRTNSVDETPVLFHSFTNPSSFPCGSKIKAIGNIDGDAIITITNEGIDGVSATGEFIMVIVKGGVVADVVAQNVSAAGYAWGSAPVNFTTVVPRTVNPADGVFLSYYGPSTLVHIAADGTVSGGFNSDTTGWGLNPNCLDSKAFNNCNYMALFVVSHFPAWGMGPQLYLYNVSDMTKFTGSDVTDLACLELTNQNIDWYQVGDYSVASGDVVIAPSADGYKLYIYYYDHNSQAFGGYVADCIKR